MESNSGMKMSDTLSSSNQTFKMKTMTDFKLEETKKRKKPNLLKERIRLKKLKELQKKQPKKIIKICDFGLSRSSAIPVQTLTNEVVTLWYRSPELLLGSSKYNESCDIWSIGCIFAEMINNRPLFMGKNVSEQLDNIFNITGSPEINEWKEVKQYTNYNPDRWRNCYKKNFKEVMSYKDSDGNSFKN
jgi:serine/threonine protein kinase